MLNSLPIILGIDPGLLNTGWGVVHVQKNADKPKYIHCGVIKTKSSDTMEHRLSLIYSSISNIIKEYAPNEIAMEEVFINSNSKTSEKLIMARATIFVCCANHGYKINSYTPNEIKKNVTGFGHSSKAQIHLMVQKILNISIEKNTSTSTIDSIDALATSLCHSFANTIFKKY